MRVFTVATIGVAISPTASAASFNPASDSSYHLRRGSGEAIF